MIRRFNPPKHRLTPVRPPPAGNLAGTGVNLSLNNPFGSPLPAGPGAAPNAKPAAPATIVQMGGAPYVGPKRAPTMKPRTGSEGRQGAEPVPVAEPAPPDPSELSPSDRVNTITHLADTTIKANKHVLAHANQAVQAASQLKDDPALPSVLHNVQHAATHAQEAIDHATKLNAAVLKYPGAKSAAAELNQPAPSKKPQPPKGKH